MSHEYMLSVLYRSYQTFTSSILEFLTGILDSHVRQIYDSISHKRCQLFKGSLTLDLYFAKEISKTNMYTFEVINFVWRMFWGQLVAVPCKESQHQYNTKADQEFNH